jgi:hypothetical protein
VLWIPAFEHFGKLPINNTMPLYELYIKGANGFPWLHPTIAILLLAGQSILLNFILNKNEILVKKSFLPALFYCLLLSCCKPMLHFYPLLFANLFILLALNKICSSYRADEAFSDMFDAGFFIAIASLFYFPSIIIFPLIWVGMIVIRPFIWREWVISFLGLLLPYLFTFTYYYWYDKLNLLLYDKIFFPSSDALLSFANQRHTFIGVVLFLVLFLFMSGIKLLRGWPVNTILSRNLLVVLLWLFGLGILSYLMAPVFNVAYLAFVAIPFAVFISNYYLTQKRIWIGELVFVGFIVCIILENYS